MDFLKAPSLITNYEIHAIYDSDFFLRQKICDDAFRLFLNCLLKNITVVIIFSMSEYQRKTFERISNYAIYVSDFFFKKHKFSPTFFWVGSIASILELLVSEGAFVKEAFSFTKLFSSFWYSEFCYLWKHTFSWKDSPSFY